MFRRIFEAVSNKYFTKEGKQTKAGMNVILRNTVLVLAVKVRRKWTCPNFKERAESMARGSRKRGYKTTLTRRRQPWNSSHPSAGRIREQTWARSRRPFSTSTTRKAFTSPLLVSSLVYMLVHSRLTFEFQWATLFCGSLLHFRNERTGRRACPRAARPLVASVNFRWNENCWQHTRIPWKRIFVVRPRDRTGGSVFVLERRC